MHMQQLKLNKHEAQKVLTHLALLDLVGLVGAELRVVRRGPGLAHVRRVAGVAGAQGLLMFVVVSAAAAQEEGGLDAGAAHLDGRRVRVGHELRRERHALVEGTLTRAVAEHRLVLDVDLERETQRKDGENVNENENENKLRLSNN